MHALTLRQTAKRVPDALCNTFGRSAEAKDRRKPPNAETEITSLARGTLLFSDDRISREIRIPGKAAYWPQRDLGCRLLACSA